MGPGVCGRVGVACSGAWSAVGSVGEWPAVGPVKGGLQWGLQWGLLSAVNGQGAMHRHRACIATGQNA